MSLATIEVGYSGAQSRRAVSILADLGVDEGDGHAVTPGVAPGTQVLVPVGKRGGVVEVEDVEVLPGVPGSALVHLVSQECQRYLRVLVGS